MPLAVYLRAFLLAAAWAFAPWTFLSASLFPLELLYPVAAFGLTVGSLGLANLTWAGRLPGRDAEFARTVLFLSTLALFGGLLWPLIAALPGLPLPPGDVWGLGQLLITVGVAALGYSFVGRLQAQTGTDLRRDLAYRFITSVTIAGAYLATLITIYPC